MVEGKKSIKNGMDRLKPLIIYDFRFKTQHQYKNHKNDTLFEMIEFREFFAEFPIVEETVVESIRVIHCCKRIYKGATRIAPLFHVPVNTNIVKLEVTRNTF